MKTNVTCIRILQDEYQDVVVFNTSQNSPSSPVLEEVKEIKLVAMHNEITLIGPPSSLSKKYEIRKEYYVEFKATTKTLTADEFLSLVK